MSRPNAAGRLALCGLLTALMLTLGFVESLIPLPLSGVKLGLSNGVLIFALYMLSAPTAFVLMGLKVLLSCATFAGFQALPYALAGGVCSLIVMALLRRVKGLSPIAISMVGGAVHNMAQVAMAMAVTRTGGLAGYMGLMMLLGLVCGLLTGLASTAVMKHLKHMKRS